MSFLQQIDWHLYHAFEDESRCFVWSGYSLAGYEVDRVVYEIFSRRLLSVQDEKAIAELESRGFPSESVAQGYKEAIELVQQDISVFPGFHLPGYYHEHIGYDRNYSNASIILSAACNLRCTYCWNNGGGAYSPDKRLLMSGEIALAAVDYLFRYCGAYLHIRFYGGEPLLNEEVLKLVVLTAEERARGEGKIVDFSISTNGLLLNDCNSAFFREHNVEVGVSLDGDREVMAKQRPRHNGNGTYDDVVASIRRAQGAGLKLSSRSTLTAEFASTWLRQADLLLGLGLACVETQFVRQTGDFGTHRLVVPVNDRKKALDEYVARLFECLRNDGVFPPIFMSNFDAIRKALLEPKFPMRSCGAGISNVCIGVDGAIYPCTGFSDKGQFVLGSVLGKDGAVTPERWMPSVEDIPKCRTCFLKYACLGGCYDTGWDNTLRGIGADGYRYGSGHGSTGSRSGGLSPENIPAVFVPPDDFCELQKYTYEKAIVLLARIEDVGKPMVETGGESFPGPNCALQDIPGI